jgi:hypothetical protein
MDEHGARKDKLLDLEILQAAQQSLGSFDRDLLVLGARLAREIIVGRQVDDRGDSLSMTIAGLP